jgi:hypothetical protein
MVPFEKGFKKFVKKNILCKNNYVGSIKKEIVEK